MLCTEVVAWNLANKHIPVGDMPYDNRADAIKYAESLLESAALPDSFIAAITLILRDQSMEDLNITVAYPEGRAIERLKTLAAGAAHIRHHKLRSMH